AAAPTTEEKPKRTRKPKADKAAPEKVEAKAAPVEAETPAPKTEPEEKKSRGGRGRGGRENRNDNRNKTVGMGDHMPSFIAKSFDERKAS
ncbi:MAG: DEAD/DEAH box helicase, partial [Paracoccaceae bacterium]